MTVAKEPAYLLLPQHNLAGRRQKALAEQGPGRPAAERQGQQPLLQGLLPFPLPSRLTTLLLVRQPAKTGCQTLHANMHCQHVPKSRPDVHERNAQTPMGMLFTQRFDKHF